MPLSWPPPPLAPRPRRTRRGAVRTACLGSGLVCVVSLRAHETESASGARGGVVNPCGARDDGG